MNRIISVLLLLILSTATFCQQTSQPVKADYLKKSRNQNTAAWVVLGGGFALSATGLIIGINGTAEQIAGIFTGETSNKYKTGEALFYTGLVAMAGSIPLFIASSGNRKKAMSLSFRNERAPQLSKQCFVYRPVPSFTLKIRL